MEDVLKKEAIFRWVLPIISTIAIAFTILILSFDNWISYWMLGLSIAFQLVVQGGQSYTRMLLRTEIHRWVSIEKDQKL